MWRRFGGYFDRRDARQRAGQGEIFAEVEQKLRSEIRIPKNRWHRHTDFSFLKPFITNARNRTT